MLKKGSILCVGGVPKPTSAMLSQSNFLFGWSRNLTCLKNRSLLEADPGPLPTAKMELFVTIAYGWKPYIIVLSKGNPP